MIGETISKPLVLNTYAGNKKIIVTEVWWKWFLIKLAHEMRCCDECFGKPTFKLGRIKRG